MVILLSSVFLLSARHKEHIADVKHKCLDKSALT